MRFISLGAVALAATLAASGCAAPRSAATTGPDAAPSARVLAATADSLRAAPGPVARRALARRVMIRSGLTPLADMGRPRSENPVFSVGGEPGAGAVVAGLVPGRWPTVRSELVVVGTDLSGPHVGPVLEAARVLAERSQWTPTPERTVMVALWTGPDGARGALTSGVWPRGNVRAVLSVGGPVGALPLVEVEGQAALDTVVLPVEPGEGAVALAQRVLDEAVRLARRPVPADTLGPTGASR